MATSKLLWGQPDKMLGVILQWTSILPRRSKNTPNAFILQKPEISIGPDEPLAHPFSNEADFTFLPYNILDAVDLKVFCRLGYSIMEFKALCNSLCLYLTL